MAMLAWCSFFLPFARYFPSHHCCPTHFVIISNADAYMPPAQRYHVTRARQGRWNAPPDQLVSLSSDDGIVPEAYTTSTSCLSLLARPGPSHIANCKATMGHVWK